MTSPSTRVFVYGTLMRGEPNHRFLARAAFVRGARTLPRFKMISLGGCPAIVSGGGTAIEGELYDVDSETLAHLDRLEGHPRFYRRTQLVMGGGGGGRAHAYLLEGGRGVEIASGSWRVWCTVRCIHCGEVAATLGCTETRCQHGDDKRTRGIRR